MAGGGRLALHRVQPLPELMGNLAHNRATGVLVASAGEARREIVFVDGEARAARSDVEEQKLGSWLVHRGLISEDERALTLLGQGGEHAPPLGHLLVTRGCLDQTTLEAELAELALSIIRSAAAAPRTYCEFLEGRASDQPDTLPALTTTQLLLVAARAFSDAAAIESGLGPHDQIVWPSSALDALLGELQLTPTEAFMLSRLDGRGRLANLYALSSLPREEAARTLYSLKVAGLIGVGAAPSPGPGPLPDLGGRRSGPASAPLIVDEERLDPNQRRERALIRERAESVTRVDHYRALDLEPGARLTEVEQAWKEIQARFSPERSGEAHLRDMRPHLSAVVERAQEAHEVLSSPAARRRYDPILRATEEQRKQLESRAAPRTDARVRSEIVEANLKRAAELVRDGEVFMAIQLLEQACAIEPRPPELLKLARLLLRNPLWTQRALAYLRQAIELDPLLVDAWIELAEFWRRRNDPERQRKALERALAHAPEDRRASEMYKALRGQRELDRLLRRARQAKT